MRLKKGLSDGVLYNRIVRYDRFQALGERALAFYLLEFSERGLFKKHGCSSAAQFAYLKLQLPVKKTRELLRVAKALEELPLIDRAFAEGRLAWSGVRELTRVATAETEQEWLERASGSTLRNIERDVSRCAFGDRPPKDPYSLSKTKLKVVAELGLEDYAVWQTAFSRLAERAGGDLDASTALLLMARSFLEEPMKPSELKARKAFQVVYHRCPDCDRAWMETGEGPVGVPLEKVARREPCAEVVRLEDGGDRGGSDEEPSRAGVKSNGLHAKTLGAEQPPHVPRGPSLPQTPAKAKELRDKPTPPKLRREILSRDGRVCAVPGCRNRGTLFAHHVEWLSHGGATEAANETCLCRACHSLIHEGLLQVEGMAPVGLRWTGTDGEPIAAPAFDPESGPRYRVDAAPRAPRGAPRIASAEARGGPISLDDIPDEIDAAWWREHGHHFEFKGKKLRLTLKKPGAS